MGALTRAASILALVLAVPGTDAWATDGARSLSTAVLDSQGRTPRTAPVVPDERGPRPFVLLLNGGLWGSNESTLPSVIVTDNRVATDNGGLMGGLAFGHRVTPQWMIVLGSEHRLLEARADEGTWDDEGPRRVAGLVSFFVGARYYVPPMSRTSSLRPYVKIGAGPTLGIDVFSRGDSDWPRWRRNDDRDRDWDVSMQTIVGGHAGVGIDVAAGTRVVVGADATYHVTSRFDDRIAGHRNGTGVTFSFHLGINLGRLPASGGRR